MAGGFVQAKVGAGTVPLGWAKTRDPIPIPILVLAQLLSCPHTALLSLWYWELIPACFIYQYPMEGGLGGALGFPGKLLMDGHT